VRSHRQRPHRGDQREQRVERGRAVAPVPELELGHDAIEPERRALVEQRAELARPIFHAAGEVDMGPALRTAGVAAAEARFVADMTAAPAPCPSRITGFAYFTLEALRDPRAWQ
jgi:hypothetical protein